MHIYSYLESIIQQAFNEVWDVRRPAKAELMQEGKLIKLIFHVKIRDDVWKSVHEEKSQKLTTQYDADDFLANALSKFLMKHPSWHR